MITPILNERQIKQKLDRIAYQIAENCFGVKTLYIIGIIGNGYNIAEEISNRLKEISEHEIIIGKLTIDKKEPLTHDISITLPLEDLENQTIILVDDVLNSGRTMQYALTKLLERPIESIKTVALVDRKHRNYPIRCDFVGMTLSTTLQERVEVDIEGGMTAFLI